MPADRQVLVACAAQFYARGWMWGTAGNLSLRLKNTPLEIMITPSGLNKGALKTSDLITVRDGVAPRHPKGRVPSAETLIHQAIYKSIPEARAVFHVHPTYATLLSRAFGHSARRRSLSIPWFEMLKGVGVAESVLAQAPILPNWQDMARLSEEFFGYVKARRSSGQKILPAILIYGHGLTCWGRTPDEARNHLEIMEFVCEHLYLASRSHFSSRFSYFSQTRENKHEKRNKKSEKR